jgi:adenylate cyclase
MQHRAAARPLLAMLLVTLVIAGALGTWRQLGLLQWLELAAYDQLLAWQAHQVTAPAPITLIEVVEHDIQQLGRWPLSDGQLETALQRIRSAEPRVVGIDIYRDFPVAPGTEALNRLLQADQRIIWVEKFPSRQTPGINAPAVLRGSARVGFSDLLVDRDNSVRRMLLFLDHDQRLGYSLALQLALRYLAAEGIQPEPDPQVPAHLRFGAVTLPPLEPNEGPYVDQDAAGYQVLLDYAGGERAFPRFTLGELLRGEVPEAALRDRIVLLGVNALSVRDDFAAPASLGDFEHGWIAGIAVHGHAVNRLLRAALEAVQPLAYWRAWQEWAWLLLWCAAGALLGWMSHHPGRYLLAAAGGAGLLFTLAAFAFAARLWIPVVPPLLGWLSSSALLTSYQVAIQRRERLRLTTLLSTQMPAAIAEAIWEQREQLLENGQIRPRVQFATLLFADLSGFTSASEQLSPAVLMAWLNHYMAVMTRLIIEYGGIVDDYAGDGIKANFGVPLSTRDDSDRRHAQRALNCALAMLAKLRELNADHAARGLPTVGMRIGIHSGEVVGGTIGDSRRMKFTTIGKAVNQAARLESTEAVAFDGKARILISADTKRLLDDHFRSLYRGRVSLKGLEEPVDIYEVALEQESCAQ